MKTYGKILASLLFLTGLVIPVSAQQAINNLYNALKYSLADSYFQVGERFTELGDAERGEEFKAQAKLIYKDYKPGVLPQAAPAQAVPAAVAPVTDSAGVPERPQVVEKNLQAEKIAKIQFSRLLRGYLDGDPAMVASVLADQVSFNGTSYAVADAKSKIETFLKDNPPQAAAPDELYDMGKMAVTTTAQGVSVSLMAKLDAPGAEKIPGWKAKQTFSFQRSGLTWKLASVQTE